MSGGYFLLCRALLFFCILKMLVDLSYNRPGHIIHKSIGSNDVGFAGIISQIG
jgi:hypothetical protein